MSDMNPEESQSGEAQPKMGRPSDYTPDVADKICSQIADGKSMRTICREESMPHMSTVFRWLREHDEFREQYVRAKDDAADAMAEDILEIADDGTNDYMTITKGDKEYEVVNGEAIQRSRLRVDSRKWLMAKLKPKKYGEHVDVTSGGERIGEVSAEQAAQLVAARADRGNPA
jgi:hypothetical protein